MLRYVRNVLKICLVLSLVSGIPKQGTAGIAEIHDPNSLSNFNDVRVTHIDLKLTIDFEREVLDGYATLTLKNLSQVDTLILDTQELTIHKVMYGLDDNPAPYSFGKTTRYFGTPLKIALKPKTNQVTVYYTTSPDAPGLQWVSPAQTAGKQFPYMYSQSEFIYARSWVPCQDSPAVRMTYSAEITASPQYLVLMSASNPQKRNNMGLYEFQMPQPVPSYLMAIAAGDVQFRKLGRRSGVYAEPSVVDDAAWEFANLSKMITAAENLYGPYRWDRYDILILPPSFPFGGMENPRLTFATPTVIAGDRSLVSLVAHELAHSWSGNLVTNATWNDFWLNEGFATYFERRITEATKGRAYAEMLSQLSYDGLVNEVKTLGADNPDTRLKVDMSGRNPEDAYTSIPYSKGYFFLRLLEEHFGRHRWDAFLKNYFDHFQFQSITTEQFASYLRAHLFDSDTTNMRQVHLHEWLYEPGIPQNIPQVHSTELAKVDSQIELWKNGASPAALDTSGWSTHHWLYFLRNIPRDESSPRMVALDSTFHLTQTGNDPVLKEWLILAVHNNYTPADSVLHRYLVHIGRLSLIRGIYKEMVKTAKGLEKARTIYREAKPLYHQTTRNGIEKILNFAG